MIEHTEGIVLHTIPYSESSVISHIYSKKFGVHSCIMSTVRTQRSKSAYFRPLSIITYSVYHTKQNLHRIKDIQFAYIASSIYDSVYKANMALFIGEFLHKLCIHTEANIDVYNFIAQYIQFLDTEDNSYTQSHIIFLIQLLQYWGISPHSEYSKGFYFDKQLGIFTEQYNSSCLSLQLSSVLHDFIESNTFASNIRCSRDEKHLIIEAIIDYYGIHTHSIGTLHTLNILKQIFSPQ